MGVSFEQVLAYLKTEAAPEELKPILAASVGRHQYQNVMAALAMSNGTEGAENPFAAGLLPASDMPPPNAPTPIWYGMYPGRVTLVIGETGAGKTSLMMNVAVHAALEQGLWDFGFCGGTRILYVDPENSGSYRDGEREGGLCAAKLERIGKGAPKNLVFHDGRGVNLSNVTHLVALKELICKHRFTLVILDPIANLFNTEDENSNAEAARQGKDLTALSRETGACIVVLHHTGKETGGNYGRGASARLAAADVGMVLRVRDTTGEEDDTYTGQTRQRNDVCRLQIVKDRPNFFGKSSKYLRMAGEDKFTMETFANWKSAGQEEKADKHEQAREELSHFLADGAWASRQAILDELKKQGIGEHIAARALNGLVTEGNIEKRQKEGRGAGLEFRQRPDTDNDEWKGSETK